jgi:hypothetical protein
VPGGDVAARPMTATSVPRSIDRRLVMVDVAIKVATVVLLAWALLNPDLPQFSGKAFTGRAIAYPIALLVLPVAWWVFARPRGLPFPAGADILLGLPFLLDVVGNALDLYDSVDWWDDANHLVNWALHTAAIGLLLRWGPWGPWTRAALAFGWAAATAVLWELTEYVAFVPNSPEAATAYQDTLGDLALGLLGGAVAAIAVSRLPASPRVGTSSADPRIVERG